MRPTPLIAAACLVLTILGCQAQPAAESTPAAAQNPAAVRAAIESIEKEWSAAYLKGDAAAVAALYAEDGATVPPAGDWGRGREGVAKGMAILDSVTVESREDVTEEVTVAGDWAVEIGHYSWTGKTKQGGKPRGETGRYMALWHKTADGHWQLYRDLGAVAPPEKK